MVDYIKSEFYRSFHNQSLRICMAVLMGLVALLAIVLALLRQDPTFPYGNTRYYLSNVYTGMDTLIYLVLIIIARVDNSEYKNHTIKHSIAVGIPRSTIYIGRMIVQAVVCIGVYLVINLEMVGLAYALLEHSHANELMLLVKAGAACLPIYLGCVAFFQCMMMNMENPLSMGILSVTLITIIPSILAVVSTKVSWVANICYWAYANLAGSNFDEDTRIFHYTWDTVGGVRNCYLAGIVGVIVFTMIGVFIYQRKEVK